MTLRPKKCFGRFRKKRRRDIVRKELEPLFAEALEAGLELMREADARRAEVVSDLAGRGAHQDNEIDAKETGHAALETQN